ncbi:MAG: hypothetical protein SFY92_01785 [Verrucomicrobiae bacterium]|nr:hypothetical protein [Verrucomicrobiae bacterium]
MFSLTQQEKLIVSLVIAAALLGGMVMVVRNHWRIPREIGPSHQTVP